MVFRFLEPRSDLYNEKHLNFSNAIEYKKSCLSRKCIKMHEITIGYHEKNIEHFCCFFTQVKNHFDAMSRNSEVFVLSNNLGFISQAGLKTEILDWVDDKVS